MRQAINHSAKLADFSFARLGFYLASSGRRLGLIESMKDETIGDITSILGHEPVDAEALLSAVYGELRQMAGKRMQGERPDHTLQPTALVHEVYLRLGGVDSHRWENRRHFFAAAAEAMRRILVDAARYRARLKRGGPDAKRIELEESQIAAPFDDDRVLLVHDALDRLAEENPSMAQIVKLRFFVGLDNPEIAKLLGIGERTVGRQWSAAKVLLFQRIRDDLGLHKP